MGSCLHQVYKTGKNIFVTTYGGKELFLLSTITVLIKLNMFENPAALNWHRELPVLGQIDVRKIFN